MFHCETGVSGVFSLFFSFIHYIYSHIIQATLSVFVSLCVKIAPKHRHRFKIGHLSNLPDLHGSSVAMETQTGVRRRDFYFLASFLWS